MSELLDTALILARQGDTDALVQLLERANRWRTGEAEETITKGQIVEALGYEPAQSTAGATNVARRWSSNWPGQPSSQFLLARWPLGVDVELGTIQYNAGTAPAADVALTWSRNGTTVTTTTLAGGTQTAQDSLDVVASEGDVLALSIDRTDADLRDLSWTLYNQ